MGRQGCTEQSNFDDIGLLYVCKTVLALWLGGARNPSEGQESQAQSLDQKYPLDKGMHGNSLQDSCLENPMDREASGATVHQLSKSKSLFYFFFPSRLGVFKISLITQHKSVLGLEKHISLVSPHCGLKN